MTSFRVWGFRAPAVVWTCVIFVLISMPNRMIPTFGFWTFVLNSDKFWHGTMFFVMAATSWTAFLTARRPHSPATPLIRAVLASFLYGVGTELFQLLLPDRFSSIGDVAANCIGIAVFALLYAAGALRSFERLVVAHVAAA